MKHEQHEDRLSFPKWAMPNQRTETQDSGKLNDRRALALMNGKRISNIGKNNGPLKHSVPAQAVVNPPAFVGPIKSRNGFLPRNVGRSNGGARVASKGKVIPAHAYAAYLAPRY